MPVDPGKESPEELVRRIDLLNIHLEADSRVKICKHQKNTAISDNCLTLGNREYNKNKQSLDKHLIKLICIFTRCIAYAPKNSDIMAKGFSNRASMLVHLHLYEEALTDLDRALLNVKSPELKANLEIRKKKCLKKLKKFESQKKLPEEIPAITPSNISPYVSKAVEVKYSEKLKRQILVAARDIEPGEFIITEKRYTCFPHEDKIHITCTHCMQITLNGIPCEKCVFAIFCNEQCKKEAMEEYHDKECPMIAEINYFIACKPLWKPYGECYENFPETMIAIRSFIKAVKKEGFRSIMNDIKTSDEETNAANKLLSNGTLDFDKFKYFYNLPRHSQNEHTRPLDTKSLTHESYYIHYWNSIAIVTALIRHTKIIPLRHKIKSVDQREKILLTRLIRMFKRLQNIVRLNVVWHQTTSQFQHPEKGKSKVNLRGLVYAPIYSLLNHSCLYNASNVFVAEGRNAIFTTTPVQKGQQLCICYSHSDLITELLLMRQGVFQLKYDFKCSCQACREGWFSSDCVQFLPQMVAKLPELQEIERQFGERFPDAKLESIGFTTEKLSDYLRDDFALEKTMFVLKLIFEYFQYGDAYRLCLLYIKYIEESYKFHRYGEKRFLPEA